jgi:hypothetical protein
MFLKDGRTLLTPDKPTLYHGKEYEGAVIKPNAETQRILANRAAGNNNREMVKELRLTRQAIENNRTNIMFSRNVGHLNKKHFKAKYK